MRIRGIAAALAFALLALPALAENDRAGDFDYYVMALSWSPSWCETEGRGRDVQQCETGRHTGFVLHGLWPQYGKGGYPSYCHTPASDPSRTQSAAMVDVMGSKGSAWYQWKKHGRCSGLSAADYYATARRAFGSVQIPGALSRLTKDVRLPAKVVEEAFLDANPGLTADEITITCSDGRIDEVRICLSKDLTPRPCGADVAQDCQMRNALLPGTR